MVQSHDEKLDAAREALAREEERVEGWRAELHASEKEQERRRHAAAEVGLNKYTIQCGEICTLRNEKFHRVLPLRSDTVVLSLC